MKTTITVLLMALLSGCGALPIPAMQLSFGPIQSIPQILIVGDSHAACRLPHSATDSWIIADRLEVPTANRLAVSGSTAAQWAADTHAWTSVARANRAPVVWLSLGGNDAVAALADGVVTPEEIRAARSNYCAVVRAIASGRSLVIATAYADPYAGYRPDVAVGILQLNSAIRMETARACNALGVPYVVLEEPEILGACHYDGSGDLHPNAEGYHRIAAEIIALINSHIGPNR